MQHNQLTQTIKAICTYNYLSNLLSLHSKVTKEKIEEFKQELSIFAESFHMHGPGAVGDDLEKGT